MTRSNFPSTPSAVLCLLLASGVLACSSSGGDSPAPSGSAGSTANGGGASGASSSAGAATGSGGSAVTGGGSTGSAGASSGNAGSLGNGGANSAGSTGNGGASSAGSGNGSSGSGGASMGGVGVTWNNVYVTWYGYDDNSCATEAQHTCANIAYPMSDGYPTLHDGATEGKGTYTDPITFASSDKGDGETFGGATINPGTIIYYPHVRKYFIMEDSCLECKQGWDATKLLHVDLWMGPSVPPQGQTMFGPPLIDCEDNTTDSSANDPTDTIIVDPPSSLPVDQTMLFTGTACTVVTYP